MRRIIAFSIVAQLVNGFPAAAQERPPAGNQDPPSAPAAVAVGGERYRALISNAWRGQGSLPPVFSYELIGWFKGPAREEHHQVLLALLRHLGDDRFGLALRGMFPRDHAVILRGLRAAAGADSTRLEGEYPLSFGPRSPGEPSVEQCGAITDHRGGIPDQRAAAAPDNSPVRLPPTAPPHVTVIYQVTAGGRVDTSVVTVLSMPRPDAATTAAAKNSLAAWRFSPARLRGCAIPAWGNLELNGTAAPDVVGPNASLGALKPGLYLGAWDDEYRTHWLSLFVGPHGAVAYDPPTFLASCAVSVRGDTVSFRTGRLTQGSSGLGFNLVFRGSQDTAGLRGWVQRTGRSMEHSGPVPLVLTRYAIDTASNQADTVPSGLYTALRGFPETGDILGDELLLLRTSRGPLALWTAYEGGPDGPYPADSVQVSGAAITIVLNEHGLLAPGTPRRTSRTFLLGPVPSRQPRADGTQLTRSVSLREFLRGANASRLPRPQCD
jgi:hypothetical protein